MQRWKSLLAETRSRSSLVRSEGAGNWCGLTAKHVPQQSSSQCFIWKSGRKRALRIRCYLMQARSQDGRSGYSSKMTNNSSLIAASVDTVRCRSTHGHSRNEQSAWTLVPSHLMSLFPGESSICHGHLLDKIFIPLHVCAMSCLHSDRAFTVESTQF